MVVGVPNPMVNQEALPALPESMSSASVVAEWGSSLVPQQVLEIGNGVGNAEAVAV